MTVATYTTSPLPSYTYNMSEGYRTLISDFDSGVEQRRNLLRFPKRTFDLIYKANTLTQRNTVENFFHNRKGSYESFWYVDFKSRSWVDEYIGRGGPFDPYSAIAYVAANTSYMVQTSAAISATTQDIYLLPATSVGCTINDAYYVGMKHPFDRCTIDINTAASATCTIAWEFYNTAGAWVSFTATTDNSSGFHLTGSNNIGWTIPSSWASCAVNGIEAYWARARLTAVPAAYTIRPLAGQIWTNTKTHDLHFVSGTSPNCTVYIDAVANTSWTYVAGGGGANSDRVTFDFYPTSGCLITCNHTGYLRIKGRFSEDSFKEEQPDHPNFFNYSVSIKEVQW